MRDDSASPQEIEQAPAAVIGLYSRQRKEQEPVTREHPATGTLHRISPGRSDAKNTMISATAFGLTHRAKSAPGISARLRGVSMTLVRLQ